MYDKNEIAVKRFWDSTSRMSSTWVHPLYSMERQMTTKMCNFLGYYWSIPIHQHPKNQIVHAFPQGQRWRSRKRLLSAKKINGKFFNSRHSPEGPMSISPLVPEMSSFYPKRHHYPKSMYCNVCWRMQSFYPKYSLFEMWHWTLGGLLTL